MVTQLFLPQRGHSPLPILGPYPLRPNGCIDQYATWYGSRPWRSPQIFGPCLLWSNGWMDQDGTWHGDRPQPRRLCVKWGLFTFFSPYLPCTLYTTPAFSSFFLHFSIPHPRHLPATTHIQPIPRYTTPPANNTPNLHTPRLPPSYFSLPTSLPFPQSLGSCFSSPLWWH